jgi:osmotically-inducible protein OsmY
MLFAKLFDGSVCQTACQLSTGPKTLLAFVAALTVAATLSGCATVPRSSNPNVDRAITADVETRFGQYASLEAPNHLDVQTINRVVYLDGLVSTGLQRRDAELLASQVPGVSKVVNSIAVAR